MLVSKDALFWLVQRAIKNSTLLVSPRIRGKIYGLFFKKVGINLSIADGVVIKYPSFLEVGDFLTINQGVQLIAKGGLRIGSKVMVGAGTKICTATHNYDDTDVPMLDQGVSYKSIEIGDDVWFGFDCIVINGVDIGSGSIIAAGSVVVSNVDPYIVVGGVPAAKIKSRK